MRARLAWAVLLAAPGLSLAVAGLFHAHALTYDVAQRWFVLHLLGMAVFPLVGLALAMLVRGRSDPLAWALRVAAATYAVCYTALDTIYGVAAGHVTREMGPDFRRSADFTAMLTTAEAIGRVGSWALIVATLAVVVDQALRHGAVGLLAAVAVPGAWLVHQDHIFAPRGVLGMALIGLGTGLAAWRSPETRWRSDATFDRVTAS